MATINEKLFKPTKVLIYLQILLKRLQITKQRIQMRISFVLVSAMLHYHLLQQLSTL